MHRLSIIDELTARHPAIGIILLTLGSQMKLFSRSITMSVSRISVNTHKNKSVCDRCLSVCWSLVFFQSRCEEIGLPEVHKWWICYTWLTFTLLIGSIKQKISGIAYMVLVIIQAVNPKVQIKFFIHCVYAHFEKPLLFNTFSVKLLVAHLQKVISLDLFTRLINLTVM